VAPPRTPLDFREAKQQLRALYDRGGEATTLYAGCPFRRWRVDFKRCCFSPRGRRGRELEWEHVVPAAVLGRRIDAWQHGDPRCVSKRGQPFRGRRCARRVSERFRHLEGDMHNLFPALGAINNARGKAAFGLIDGEERAFGRCDLEITADLIEPRPAARGDIARACLYMDGAYPDLDLLDEPARRLLTGWSQADPPDDWERRRNEHIALVQGNRNPWIR
jgi:deoxyribonuclease-1